MYAQDFPKENGMKDAVGSRQRRVRPTGQDDGADASSGLEWVRVFGCEGLGHSGVWGGLDPSSQPSS